MISARCVRRRRGAAFGAAQCPGSLVLLSAGLAVIEQAGDLAESGVKRRFGVKDSEPLIPGHGGLLDRVDGLIVAAPVFRAVSRVPGEKRLAWW